METRKSNNPHHCSEMRPEPGRMQAAVWRSASLVTMPWKAIVAAMEDTPWDSRYCPMVSSSVAPGTRWSTCHSRRSPVPSATMERSSVSLGGRARHRGATGMLWTGKGSSTPENPPVPRLGEELRGADEVLPWGVRAHARHAQLGRACAVRHAHEPAQLSAAREVQRAEVELPALIASLRDRHYGRGRGGDGADHDCIPWERPSCICQSHPHP